MIWYKTERKDDPYSHMWTDEKWLCPAENIDKMNFPFIVTVEPTNACQNKCLYCSRQLMEREIGYMTLGVLELIAQESGAHGAAIRHGGFGEPLLHPEITDIIAICKEYGVLTTIFTNANLLTEETMRSFVESGLDEIRFSSSGITPHEHNRIRKNSDYDKDFDEKVKMAFEIRKKMNAKRPYLTIYANVLDYDSNIFKENIEGYRRKYFRYVDKIDIDRTVFSRVKYLDHIKELYEKQTAKETYKKCVSLLLKLIVHWNGDVFACDRVFNFDPTFYLGTIGREGFALEKAYNSEKIAKLRNELSFSMNHEKFDFCRDCYSATTKWDNKEEWLKKK